MMRFSRLVAAALLLWPSVSSADGVPVDLELVLAVDVSLSVDAGESELQRNGYSTAFRDPEVQRAIKSGILGRIAVTYVEWAGGHHTETIVPWTLVDGPAAANALAARLDKIPPTSDRWTSISSMIDHGATLFNGNGYEGTRRVLDISGDGPNNNGDLVPNARDRVVKQGIVINGLPILDEGRGMYSYFNIPNLDLYYRDCVIGGPGAFIEVAANFKDFAHAVRRKLILEIVGVPPEPAAPGQQAAQLQLPLKYGPGESPPCDIGERLIRARDDF